MAEFCIRREVATQLLDMFKNKGITIEDLRDAPTEGRIDAFTSVGMEDGLAHYVNTAFEKAMASNKADALQEWVKTGTTPKESEVNPLVKKLEDLRKLGQLEESIGDDFLMDLVEDKMGVSLSAEEIREIAKRTDKLQEMSQNRTATGQFTEEYFVAQRDLQNYILGLNPSSGLKLATSVWGRANLLGIPSALLNAVSNLSPSTTMAIARRIHSRRIAGYNPELAKTMNTENRGIWYKTRMDVTRADSDNAGNLRMGESVTHAEGPGQGRAATRIYEDVIFNILQGYADFESANLAFVDSLNVYSSKMADQAGKKGAEAKTYAADLMKDANRLDPQTEQGIALRELAIADARFSTWTEDGVFGKAALGARRIFDEHTGDLRLGEFLMPFVKQPANAIQRSVEATGIGAGINLFKIKDALRSAKEGNTLPMQNVIRRFVESGAGLAVAFALVMAVNPDDFIPEYDLASPKEKAMIDAKNATANSVKMYGHYVSLDYFGVFTAPMLGWLYARKYNWDGLRYLQGVAAGVSRAPGLSEIAGAAGSIVEDAQETNDFGAVIQRQGAALIGSVLSRVIIQSGTLSNIDKGTDVARKAEKGNFGEQVLNAIPFARRALPAKINQTTGEPKQNENLATMLLFGSRMKTASTDPVILEIKRLNDVDKAPAVSNIEYNSKPVKGLQKQLGSAKFQEALEYFGSEYHALVTDLMNEDIYKEMTDEQKRVQLNKIRKAAVKMMLYQYEYDGSEAVEE